MTKEEFTITVYTENQAGLLNRIAMIFTRRKLNIESLNTSPSEIESVFRFTIVITETFDVIGKRTPRADLTLVIHRKNGERVEVPVTLRLDTEEEVSVYEAGGVLQRFAKDFLEKQG